MVATCSTTVEFKNSAENTHAAGTIAQVGVDVSVVKCEKSVLRWAVMHEEINGVNVAQKDFKS